MAVYTVHSYKTKLQILPCSPISSCDFMQSAIPWFSDVKTKHLTHRKYTSAYRIYQHLLILLTAGT